MQASPHWRSSGAPISIRILRIVNIVKCGFSGFHSPLGCANRPSQKFATWGIAMRHIRKSEVIDRNAPELAGLFDHLRDTLAERHGITKARYVHLAPSTAGLRLKVSTSPALRPLAIDLVENRRHLLLYDLAERLRRPDPTRFSTDGGAAEDVPEPLRSARQQYEAHVSRLIGEGWWHGFEVPTFGPCGRRGVFLINAPLEQPLTNAYVTDVRRDLQDFRLAYSASTCRPSSRSGWRPQTTSFCSGWLPVCAPRPLPPRSASPRAEPRTASGRPGTS
jgi:hypothetical protein